MAMSVSSPWYVLNKCLGRTALIISFGLFKIKFLLLLLVCLLNFHAKVNPSKAVIEEICDQ